MKLNLSNNKKTANRGITLIALVITIIVLLILAGVSIAMLTGENGVLTQANTAKTRTVEAQVEEEIKLAYNVVQTDSYVNGWDINKKAEEMQKELQKEDSSATVTVNGTNLEISYKGYETTISSNGTVGTLAKANIVINKFEVSGTPAETVPVPTGFVHVGGSVDEGYVISDNSADENKGVDSEELLGNQFVWVPVEKEQKVKIDVSSEEEITSIVVTDPYSDELEIPEVSGKKYSAEVNPTINGRYKLTVTTASGEAKNSVIIVHSLYAMDVFIDYQLTDEFAQTQWYEAEGRNFKNIQEFIEVKMGEGLTVDDIFTMMGPQMKTIMYAETENYTAKVNTNGGFYIARYEATYEDGKVASKKATVESRTSDSTPLTNGMLWNFINQEDALEKAKAYNTSVTSTLPTGAAWDRVMGWLIETKEKTGFEVSIDSTSWGNYYNDEFSNTEDLIKTGEFEETEANNIYDLAGNLWEWTTEACGSARRVSRGGYYNNKGSNNPASNRFSSDPEYSYNDIGLRLTLFL